MRLLSLFWRSILLWTAIISLLLFGITVVTGSEVPVASAPVWIGLAFMLAAYPSGIRVAPEAIPGPGLSFSRLGLFVAASASASVATFMLVNWLAPLLLSAGPGVPVGAGMTLSEIRDELRVLGEVARGGPPTAENWLPFNQFGGSVAVGAVLGRGAGRGGRPRARNLAAGHREAHWFPRHRELPRMTLPSRPHGVCGSCSEPRQHAGETRQALRRGASGPGR